MSNCTRCHQPIDAQAVICPHCGNVLKAYGHPGIPLHQATGDTFLCDSCTYHEDDTCTFPQRPYAKTCTLYQDKSQPSTTELSTSSYQYTRMRAVKAWCQRNKGLLILLGLIFISFLIALIR
ncbi:MAG: zinc ribbon domain-containing protein [Xenococcaceae cyanobacterium]